jgi:D-amino peptidase
MQRWRRSEKRSTRWRTPIRINQVRFVAILALASAPALAGQGAGRTGAGVVANPFLGKQLPLEPGYRVYIVAAMSGMGTAVDARELSPPVDGAPLSATVNNADYETRFRSLFTQEANAAVHGARLAGAGSIVVSDAHPANNFGSILPWEIDSLATLVRGFPRPLFMISGLDSTFGTVMFIGATASAGTPGVLSHTFGFDALAIDGKVMNEVTVNALIAGEMGVPVSLVAGDDAAIAECRAILGSDFVPVITKYAVGTMAAITLSPARVHQVLATGATLAVQSARDHRLKPFTMEKPYRVEFTLAKTLPDSVSAEVAALTGFGLERTGARSFRFTTADARQIGYLIDAIEPLAVR